MLLLFEYPDYRAASGFEQNLRFLQNTSRPFGQAGEFIKQFSKDSDILTSDEIVARNRPCVLLRWVVHTQLTSQEHFEVRLLWMCRNIAKRLHLELFDSYLGLWHRLPSKPGRWKQHTVVTRQFQSRQSSAGSSRKVEIKVSAGTTVISGLDGGWGWGMTQF